MNVEPSVTELPQTVQLSAPFTRSYIIVEQPEEGGSLVIITIDIEAMREHWSGVKDVDIRIRGESDRAYPLRVGTTLLPYDGNKGGV